MITAFQIYLMSLADSVLLLFLVIILISVVSMLLLVMDYKDIREFDDDKEKEKKNIHNKKNAKAIIRCLMSALLSVLVLVFVPSTKTLVAMYVIPRVVNNTNVQKLPEAILRFVENYAEKKII